MKTHVYIWRLKSERKITLEEVARKQNRAVVGQWLGEQSDVENEEVLQQRLR